MTSTLRSQPTRRIKTGLVAIAVAACLSVFASPAMADVSGDFTYTDSGTAVTITGCSATCPATLTIPSSIGGHPVTVIGDSAFIAKSSIERVTIPNSVVTIASQAFSGNSGLKSVTFQRVSKVATIGGFAFYNAPNLEAITLPPSLVTIDEAAFQSAIKLASLTIPSKVTTIGDGAFATLVSLNRLSFAAPSHVTTIGLSAFQSAVKLTSVSLPSTLASIGAFAFEGSTLLSSISFAGIAPTVGGAAFDAIATVPLALVSANLTGYGVAGSDFHGLTVRNPVLALTKGKVKATRSLVTWTTSVMAPGAGKIKLTATTRAGRRVTTHCTVNVTSTAAGVYAVACKIGKSGRGALRRGPLKLTITTAFTPTVGRKTTKVQALTLKRAR
ncbi:MAG: leucine-rich repeat protein [Actinobacteria bacterium]|uniref:Unannotated protein n=1 Tax=freshwater metagenome TaxID=449393 RepID=A0A6J7EIV7_9ZZZZ|nr:leucine-rich repeat protein [Actinomycetota bacterium]